MNTQKKLVFSGTILNALHPFLPCHHSGNNKVGIAIMIILQTKKLPLENVIICPTSLFKWQTRI